MTDQILITGADGYIGDLVCQRLLVDTDCDLQLWVRADTEAEFLAKRDRLLQRHETQASRLHFNHGNLRDPHPFATVDPAPIRRIIHTAAVTAFNVEAETANQVNRDGTRKLLEFARDCPALERLCYVSTAYVAGLVGGPITETPLLAERKFANHYERSKWEAEQILLTEFADLPWQIYRPATVISHDNQGTVVQYNVFHNTMRLLFYGLISMLPGHEDTPVYLVTGQFVADCIVRLATAETANQQVYNLCHSQQESLTLGDIINNCFKAFQQDAGFVKRRVLRPLITEQEPFELLADGLTGLSGQVVTQAIASIRPFAPQMFLTKSFDNDNLKQVITDYQAPHAETLILNTVQNLIQSKWGRETHD